MGEGYEAGKLTGLLFMIYAGRALSIYRALTFTKPSRVRKTLAIYKQYRNVDMLDNGITW